MISLEYPPPVHPGTPQSSLVQCDCHLLCMYKAEFKCPVLEAVSAFCTHFCSTVSLLYYQMPTLSAGPHGPWTTCMCSLGFHFTLKTKSGDSSLFLSPALSVLPLLNNSSTPYASPTNDSIFIHTSCHLNLAILFQICRGLGRGLSQAYSALLSLPPSSSIFLLFAFFLFLHTSILFLFHAEQLHQLLQNLGNRRYPISPGLLCHSKLIKAKPNIVGPFLGKSFACCRESSFSWSHYTCISVTDREHDSK